MQNVCFELDQYIHVYLFQNTSRYGAGYVFTINEKFWKVVYNFGYFNYILSDIMYIYMYVLTFYFKMYTHWDCINKESDEYPLSSLLNHPYILFTIHVISTSFMWDSNEIFALSLQVFKKMDGIREMYRGIGLKPIATFSELPLIRPLSDKMYDIFAANRVRLGRKDSDCSKCKKD